MRRYLSLKYTFDRLVALAAVSGLLGMLQTFMIGRHYLIPTAILVVTLLGAEFDFVFAPLPLVLALLVWQYAKHNGFGSKPGQDSRSASTRPAFRKS